MPTFTPERAEQVVAGWRTSAVALAGYENPSGPLYASGAYAEGDIAMDGARLESGHCGTICTYSRGRYCC